VREPGSGDERAEPHAVSGSGPGRSRREVQQACRKAHRRPWRRRGTIALSGGLALLLVVVGMAYLKLNSNMNELDVSGQLGKRPAKAAEALASMNVLVMGSDTRTGLGTNKFGTTKDRVGQASDTTLIVHLSGDRQSAVVVSVPRDSMTRAPRDCKDTSGKVADGPIRAWNENFALGGPACLIRTVEGNTNIHIDHFVVLNFVGFQSMVDALGSVEVCMPQAVNDPKSHLTLPKGRSRLSGDQALAYVRVRYNFGKDASDILRINRQQAFMSSMVQEATSSKLLLRPDKITVQISNASGVTGLARRAADDPRLQGFVIAGISTSTSSTEGVTVGYSSLYVQRARTVAAAFPGATLVKDESAGSIIRVTLGSGSPNVADVSNRLGSTPLPSHTSTTSSTPSPSVTIKARTADSDICAKSPA